MRSGGHLDGVPVWNKLRQDHRAFALRALETLNECLDDSAIPFGSAPFSDPVALKHPGRDVRDVELRLRPSDMGFAVTHGLHKLYRTDFSDFRPAPVPSNFDELRMLLALWTDCVRSGTSAAEKTRMAALDGAALRPAMAAASRFAPDWRRLEMLSGALPGRPAITLRLAFGQVLRFRGREAGLAWSDGYLSPALASLLSGARSYVAIYRSDWSRKSSIHIELGPGGPIDACNDLDPLQTLRAVAEAHERQWELLETPSS